jgi:hypothetical protein
MTIQLHNGQHNLQMTDIGWDTLLEVGRRRGWHPAGTEPPEWDDPAMQAAYGDGPGLYYTSVTRVDAQALADALDGITIIAPGRETSGLLGRLPVPVSPLEHHGARPPGAKHTEQHLVAILAGDNRRMLPQFVAFARQGRFLVGWSDVP